MNPRLLNCGMLLCVLASACCGCDNAPGKPKAGEDAVRPEQVTDFATLYGQNCAACHGVRGANGAAISLANPVYLAYAGATNIQLRITSGVAGTSMPGFGKTAGGMLTGAQIEVLAQGMIGAWGNPSALQAQTPPAYASDAAGDAVRGQAAFVAACARCHGTDGAGIASQPHSGPNGSIVDPAYLALISDQGLRSIVVAGKPDQGMPDWRSDKTGNGARPLTGQEIADIVAWLASHRSAAPGQPYQAQP